ncbi:MAG: ribonuclease III [Dehalococcoidia bacterium]
MSLQPLESILGFRFNNQGLLRQALVHRSFLNEQGGSPLESYERMEFLGDAILELVVSCELYRILPNLSEGELTKSRAALVCGPSLAKIARRLTLGDYLMLGKGEEATGGRMRESNLAAALEAVVAAIYLDQGQEKAQEFILKMLSAQLENFSQTGAAPENPKSRLQEHFQGLGRPSPKYQVVSTEGPDHSPVFTVEVRVEEDVIGTGQGGKKADAEKSAAEDALARLSVSAQAGEK